MQIVASKLWRNNVKIVNVISKCCNAEVKAVGGLPDFIGDRYACTMSYRCMKCQEYCNIKGVKSYGKSKRKNKKI